MDNQQMADKAIQELKGFIDTEEKFIIKEHVLSEKLIQVKDIINHLLDINIEDTSPRKQLEFEMLAKLDEIIGYLESDRLRDINFEKEEEIALNKLEHDIKNKDWRLIKKDIKADIIAEDNILRLEVNEILNIYNMLHALIAVLNQSKLKDAEENEQNKKQIYYFSKLFKLTSAYMDIIKEMYDKEKILLDQVEESL